MKIELISQGFEVDQQRNIPVYYHGQVVGEYWTDLVVNNLVILELKAARQMLPEHEAQLLNYLKATHLEVGLILNFGPKPEHKRKTYDNERKGSFNWMKRTI
jgi:GxxExxY protein